MQQVEQLRDLRHAPHAEEADQLEVHHRRNRNEQRNADTQPASCMRLPLPGYSKTGTDIYAP